MKEVRCGKCHKKLAEGDYRTLAIKCPRCGTLNHWSDQSAQTQSVTNAPEGTHRDAQPRPAR